MSNNKAYAKAGVDIDLKARLLKSIKADVKRASRPEVLGTIGGFGGLFDLSKSKYKKPVLVSSTDSVGTKLKSGMSTAAHSRIWSFRAPPRGTVGLSVRESDLMRKLQKHASRLGWRLFRNNVGKTWIGNSTVVRKKQLVFCEPGDVVIRQARRFHAGLMAGSG